MAGKTKKQHLREIDKAFSNDEAAHVIELARKYLEEYPDSAVVLFYYGRTLTDFRRFSEAEKVLRKLMEVTEKESLRMPYCEMGRLFEERGDVRQAEEWYRKASRAAPLEATYLIFIGAMHYRGGKLAEAEQSFRAALLCKEGCFDEAYFNLGSVLVARGRLEEAIEYFKKAIEIDPKYKEAKFRLKDAEKALSVKQA